MRFIKNIPNKHELYYTICSWSLLFLPYKKIKPSYGEAKSSYSAPVASYGESKPAYSAPRPAYGGAKSYGHESSY